MSSDTLAAGLRHLRGRMAVQYRNEESDEQLLAAFTTRRDEDAFAVLVRRYGPMVLHVCRRVLGQQQDAEDAFQAVFLLLARNATDVRKKSALAGFLHGAAYRIALTAKRSAARRRKHEGAVPSETRPSANPVEELSWREVRLLLDEEIAQLPEKYRTVFVLCHLENLSQADAARRLGMNERTLSSRLMEARKRLGQRLARRGVKLTALLTASALAAQSASALPAALMATTIKAALVSATGKGMASVVSASLAELVQGVTATTMTSKIKSSTLILLAVILLGGVGSWTVSANRLWLNAEAIPSPSVSKPQSSQAKAPETPRKQKGKIVIVSGQVLDPNGKPLSGAKVYYYLTVIMSTSGREAREAQAASDADGRFRFQMPQSDLNKLEQDTPWDHVMVVAVASGYGPAWTRFRTAAEAASLKLRLVKDDVPINCRILDLEGRPIPAVTVRTHTIDDGQGGRLDLDILPLLQKETRTDAEGRFKLTGIGRERNVQLSLRGPTIAARERDLFVMTRVAKPSHVPINKRVPELGKLDYYGATSDIVAAPTKPIVGTVRDKDTGKPLAGVTIQSFMRSGHGRLVQDFLRTTSDQEGRYRLLGLPKGEGNEIRAISPAGMPYFSSLKRVENTLGLEPVRVDFALKRGVWIRGHVTAKATGKPVRARVLYGAFLDNPHLRGVPGYDGAATAVTGEDGSFAVLGLPGRGLLAIKADEDRFLPSVGADQIPATDKVVTNFEFIQTHPGFVAAEYHAFVKVNPELDSKAAACDVQLDSGKTVQGIILDPDGKPLDGVKVMDLKLMWSMPPPLAGHQFTATALDPANPRQLFFYHRGKQLGAAVVVRGDEEKPVTVRLQPCGSVTGRILGARGEPLPDFTIYGRAEKSYMSITTGRWWQLYVSARTDKEGRFHIDLIPGVKYEITVGGLNQPLDLKPGESKDLGDTKMK